jgi:hypothetical protein
MKRDNMICSNDKINLKNKLNAVNIKFLNIENLNPPTTLILIILFRLFKIILQNSNQIIILFRLY